MRRRLGSMERSEIRLTAEIPDEASAVFEAELEKQTLEHGERS